MADRPTPFDGIEELLDRLNRQFETATRSWERDADDREGFGLPAGGSGTSLDLADRGEEYVVTVDVPGYETDDLELRLAGESLTVSGERTREEDVDEGREGERYIRREREAQSFDRRVRVPEPVDGDGATATVNNGILTVRLPKLEDASDARSIDIE